jgi:hypothetical protein
MNPSLPPIHTWPTVTFPPGREQVSVGFRRKLGRYFHKLDSEISSTSAAACVAVNEPELVVSALKTGRQALEQFAVITHFEFPDVSILSNPGSKLAQFRELPSALEHQSRHPPASVSSKRNDAFIGIHVAVLGEAKLRGGQCR